LHGCHASFASDSKELLKRPQSILYTWDLLLVFFFPFTSFCALTSELVARASGSSGGKFGGLTVTPQPSWSTSSFGDFDASHAKARLLGSRSQLAISGVIAGNNGNVCGAGDFETKAVDTGEGVGSGIGVGCGGGLRGVVAGVAGGDGADLEEGPYCMSSALACGEKGALMVSIA